MRRLSRAVTQPADRLTMHLTQSAPLAFAYATPFRISVICEYTHCKDTSKGRECYTTDGAPDMENQLTYGHWEALCLEGVPNYGLYCPESNDDGKGNLTNAYWTMTYGPKSWRAKRD